MKYLSIFVLLFTFKCVANFKCAKEFGFFADDDDCQAFYQCYQWKPHKHSCGGKQLWNEKGQHCDWEANVKDCVMDKDDDDDDDDGGGGVASRRDDYVDDDDDGEAEKEDDDSEEELDYFSDSPSEPEISRGEDHDRTEATDSKLFLQRPKFGHPPFPPKSRHKKHRQKGKQKWEVEEEKEDEDEKEKDVESTKALDAKLHDEYDEFEEEEEVAHATCTLMERTSGENIGGAIYLEERKGESLDVKVRLYGFQSQRRGGRRRKRRRKEGITRRKMKRKRTKRRRFYLLAAEGAENGRGCDRLRMRNKYKYRSPVKRKHDDSLIGRLPITEDGFSNVRFTSDSLSLFDRNSVIDRPLFVAAAAPDASAAAGASAATASAPAAATPIACCVVRKSENFLVAKKKLTKEEVEKLYRNYDGKIGEERKEDDGRKKEKKKKRRKWEMKEGRRKEGERWREKERRRGGEKDQSRSGYQKKRTKEGQKKRGRKWEIERRGEEKEKNGGGGKKGRKQLTAMTNFNVVSREETEEGRKEGHRGVREGRGRGERKEGERIRGKKVERVGHEFKTVYEATNTQFIGF